MNEDSNVLIVEIEKLLNSINGVDVLDVDGAAVPRIDLTIETHEAHLLLEYCSEAANVKLNCWAHHKPNSVDAISNPALALRYRFLFDSVGEGTSIDKLCDLGAFLAWTLFETGKINAIEEKRLVKVFKAISKS